MANDWKPLNEKDMPCNQGVSNPVGSLPGYTMLPGARYLGGFPTPPYPIPIVKHTFNGLPVDFAKLTTDHKP